MPDSSITRTYRKDHLEIVWKQGLCEKCGICHATLPKVFDPARRPWVDPMQASTAEIIDTVSACPTKALSYRNAQTELFDPHAENA